MSKTVVGLFRTTGEAEQVKQTLVADGIPTHQIKVVANDSGDAAGDASATASEKGYTDIGSGGGTGIGEKVSSFFRNLTGGDEHAHRHYARGVNEGGALLTATVDDERAESVAATMKEYGAREIEGGEQTGRTAASSYPGSETAGTGTSGTDAAYGSNTAGERTIPVVEEELVVGKREVDRGGVRIYSHIVERPAEADVMLRDERVNVERRTVDRPATAADFEVGNSPIEVRASGEEAVVGKSSRVVEEVTVGKQTSEHNEAIHESVRKTEVEVEQIPGNVTEKNRY